MTVCVDVEDLSVVWSAITGEGGHMVRTATPDEAFEDTEASNPRERRRAILSLKIDIPVVQRNSLLLRFFGGEDYPSQTNPMVRVSATCPMDLAVCQNVNTRSVLVVVHGEDQPLVGEAVAGKLGQQTPLAATDVTADNANTISKVDVGNTPYSPR
jgi:hypothetical protein